MLQFPRGDSVCDGYLNVAINREVSPTVRPNLQNWPHDPIGYWVDVEENGYRDVQTSFSRIFSQPPLKLNATAIIQFHPCILFNEPCGTNCCNASTQYCADVSLSLCCDNGLVAVDGICCKDGENNCNGVCCQGLCTYNICNNSNSVDKICYIPTSVDCPKLGGVGPTCQTNSDCSWDEYCVGGCCVLAII